MQKNRIEPPPLNLLGELQGWERELEYIALSDAEPGSDEFERMKDSTVRIIQFKLPDERSNACAPSIIVRMGQLQTEARQTIQTLRDREYFFRHQQEWVEPKPN